MKNVFLKLMVLLAAVSLNSFAFDLGEVKITGLKSYKERYVTLYLVQAGKILGAQQTVRKVISRIGTSKINNENIIIPRQNVRESWDNLIVPNFIVAVIHEVPMHALNKHPISQGKFDAAPYLDNNEFIAPTGNNQTEYNRKYQSISISDLAALAAGLSFDFSK